MITVSARSSSALRNIPNLFRGYNLQYVGAFLCKYKISSKESPENLATLAFLLGAIFVCCLIQHAVLRAFPEPAGCHVVQDKAC